MSEDGAELRISDADRHAVSEILREAAGEGRLDLEELDERLGLAYRAKTYGDLVPITRDLPAGQVPALVQAAAVEPVVPGSAGPVSLEKALPEKHFLMMSGLERRGQWPVPLELRVTCVMGGADLDLTEATFAGPEVEITVNAVMGGANLKVGPHVDVVMEGTGVMGGFSGPQGVVVPDADGRVQRLRVKGVAFWGGVSVERRD